MKTLIFIVGVALGLYFGIFISTANAQPCVDGKCTYDSAPKKIHGIPSATGHNCKLAEDGDIYCTPRKKKVKQEAKYPKAIECTIGGFGPYQPCKRWKIIW